MRRWGGLERTVSRHQRFANRRHYRVKPWTKYMEIYWGERAQAYVTPISEEEICIVVMGERAQDAIFSEAMVGLARIEGKVGESRIERQGTRGDQRDALALRRFISETSRWLATHREAWTRLPGKGCVWHFHRHPRSRKE